MTVRSDLRDLGPARVLDVRLARPDRANALDPATVDALDAAFARAEEGDVDLVVLTAEGRVFCGGIDLSDADDETDATWLHRFCRIQLLLERVGRSPATTVARVEGPALGVGADLVLATDVRLATPQARLAFPGSRFGVVLGTARLAALAGPAFAQEVTLTRCTIDAARAERAGLWKVHDAGADVDIVADLAREAAITGAATRARLRAAVAPPAPADPLGALVRSLVGESGLAERVRRHRDAVRNTRAPSPSSVHDPVRREEKR